MKKYIPKKGETVRVINGEPGGITGWVGIVESMNNIGEIWVRDPIDKNGWGGLCKEVVPHQKKKVEKMRTILLEYKAGETTLQQTLTAFDNFVYRYTDYNIAGRDRK